MYSSTMLLIFLSDSSKFNNKKPPPQEKRNWLRLIGQLPIKYTESYPHVLQIISIYYNVDGNNREIRQSRCKIKQTE